LGGQVRRETQTSGLSSSSEFQTRVTEMKAYPQQSEQAFATYQAYVDRGAKIPNLRYVGRHAEFKYWGMPETVNAAYQKAPAFPPV
jgi:UDP-galactopyranose mutase